MNSFPEVRAESLGGGVQFKEGVGVQSRPLKPEKIQPRALKTKQKKKKKGRGR